MSNSASAPISASVSLRASPRCRRCGELMRGHDDLFCVAKQIENIRALGATYNNFAATLLQAPVESASGVQHMPSAQPTQASSIEIPDGYPKKEVESEVYFNLDPVNDDDNDSDEEGLEPKPLEPEPLTALAKARCGCCFQIGSLVELIKLCLLIMLLVVIYFVTVQALIAVLVSSKLCILVPGNGIFGGVSSKYCLL
ncbi:hypothetical protein BKA70DRAFT_1278520, partial [Coprinopsis sp. MPI-PUGE-AT-0042]